MNSGYEQRLLPALNTNMQLPYVTYVQTVLPLSCTTYFYRHWVAGGGFLLKKRKKLKIKKIYTLSKWSRG